MSENVDMHDKGAEITVPSFTATTAEPLAPSQLTQLASEVPNGVEPLVAEPLLQVDAADEGKEVSKAEILASHSCELPFYDGYTYTKTMFEALVTMVENYQRKFHHPFFSVFPQLVILFQGETRPTQDQALADYRIYCHRLAEYAWHYDNAVCRYAGAITNVITWSRDQGSKKARQIASQLKWPTLNSLLSNFFNRIPVRPGLLEALVEVAKIGVGRTSYGAEVISFPYFIDTVYGNRAWHCESVDNFVTSAGTDGADVSHIDIDTQASNYDAMLAATLETRMNLAITEYQKLTKTFMTPDGHQITWAPHDPIYDNCGTMRYRDSNSGKARAKMAIDGFDLEVGIAQNNPNTLPTILLNNAYYWADYISENFPEMLSPQHPLRRFFEENCKVLRSMDDQGGKVDPFQAFYNQLRNNRNVDIASGLVPLMTYKRDNAVNTATIVKNPPLVGGTTGDARDSYANLNFGAGLFDLDNDDLYESLVKAKAIPGLTPAIFGSGAVDSPSGADGFKPFVLNTIPTLGCEGVDRSTDPTQPTQTNEIVGKFATLLDDISIGSLDVSGSEIGVAGFSADFVKSWLDKNQATKFREDPTQVHVFMNPIFNCCDPYACGFAVLLETGEKLAENEWDKYFKNAEMFDLTNFTGAGQQNVVNPDDSSVHALHWADDFYRSLRKNVFVFLGASIFDHPYTNLFRKQARNPGLIMGRNVSTLPAELYENAGTDWDIAYANATNGAQLVLGTDWWSGKIAKEATPGIGWGYSYQYFDFQYGPVRIFSYLTDTDLDMRVSDIFFDSGSGMQNTSKTNAALKVAWCGLEADAAVAYPNAHQAVGDTSNGLLSNWLPFIGYMRERAVRVSESYPILDSTHSPSKAMFSSNWDFWRLLLNTNIIKFAGWQKACFFWGTDRVRDLYRSGTVASLEGTTYDMPEFNVIALMRVPRTKQERPAKTEGALARYKPETTPQQVAADAYASTADTEHFEAKEFKNKNTGAGNDRTGKGPRKGQKGNGKTNFKTGKTGGRSFDRQEKQDGFSDFGFKDDEGKGSKSSKEGQFDPTTRKQDNKVKEQSGASAREVQAMQM